VRWSELPQAPHLVFLALGLERALGESGSQAAASIASERPWPGAPLVAGAAFEVVAVLAAASASARCDMSLGPLSSILALPWLPRST
jgi:hypothetical protein